MSSGGQKHRAQIARLLLTDASVLLLDEPTNHLDVSGIEFLEGWLVERKTSVALSALVVSHDRRFLNAVADRIVEVANGRLEDYPGDYATYRRLKAERDRVRAKEAEKQRQMIERTEEFIRRNIAGQKTKQAQGRRKMLAKLERVEAPEEDANDVSILRGGASPEGASSRRRASSPVIPRRLIHGAGRSSSAAETGCRSGAERLRKTTLLKNLSRVLPPPGLTVPGVMLIGYYDRCWPTCRRTRLRSTSCGPRPDDEGGRGARLPRALRPRRRGYQKIATLGR